MSEEKEVKWKKPNVLEDVMISYNEGKGKFYSHAKLMIDGYSVVIPSIYYDSVDDALEGIKSRILEAVLKFKPDQP
jgi:hypothetical protein